VILFTLAVFGCSGGGSDGSSGEGSQGGYAAVCDLSNSQSSLVVCISFPVSNAETQAECANGGSEYDHYSADGASSSFYMAPTTPGSTISCAETNTDPLIGTCALSDRSIDYYSATWSSEDAEMDCSSRQGKWSG
jgi:hypothetical protein